MRRFSSYNLLSNRFGCIVVWVNFSFNNASYQISIITRLNPAFSVISLIVAIVTLGLFTYQLLAKKHCSQLDKILKYLKWVMLSIILISLLEYLVFPIIRAFIEIKDLNAIPPKSEFLQSIAYIITRFAKDLLKGVLITIELSLVGTLAGLLLAMLLVSLRILKPQKHDSEIAAFLKTFFNKVSALYVNIFRGTPMMVQAVIIYYLVPVLISSSWGIPQDQIDRLFTHLVAGFIVVSLNTAAYLTEVLRGAIESIDKGQMEAARSLGLSYRQAMLKIIFPQISKMPYLRLATSLSSISKDTSVPKCHWCSGIILCGARRQNALFRTIDLYYCRLDLFGFNSDLFEIIGFIGRK